MTPVNSSGKKKYFAASAGSVLWDGPDIPCLNLCKGDSVADVQYKAAQLICILKNELDLSDLDLKDIFDNCADCPEPEKKLHTVLQTLINQVDTLLKNSSDDSNTVEEKRLALASCLREVNEDGDTIDVLYHSDYTLLIGRRICGILTAMSGLTSRLETVEEEVDDLKGRVQELEQDDNALDQIKDRVIQLEIGAENLANVLGSATKLANVLSEECEGSGPDGALMALDGSGGALYTGNSGDVAESIKRLWKVACDLRTAVKVIQDNCCQLDCDDILIDFDIKLTDGRTKAMLFFVAKSHLPNGFTDVKPIGNTLTITDAAGHTHQTYIKISEAVQDVEGIDIDLANTALDPTLDYFFSMDAAVKSEKLTCMKCISKTAAYTGGSSDCEYCEITATASGDLNSIAVIVYELNEPSD